MMMEMLPIMAETKVMDQFSRQKTELNFSRKSDSDFVMFLLETTVSMISVVKHVTPVIKAVEEVAFDNSECEGFTKDELNGIHSGGRRKHNHSNISSDISHNEQEGFTEDTDCPVILGGFSEEMNDLINNLSSSSVEHLTEVASSNSDISHFLSELDCKNKSMLSDLSSFSDSFNLKMRRFRCNVCHKTFKRSSHLRCHEAIHAGKGNNQAQCTVCGKSVGKGYLKEHMRIHMQSKWQCEFCNKVFSLRNYLAKHMKRFHGDKRFKCHLCERAYTTGRELEKHLPLHEQSTPYSCSICSKSFAHYSSLKRHQISHTGVKKYQCEMCNKMFMRKDSLNNHKILSCTGKPDTSGMDLQNIPSILGNLNIKNLLSTVSGINASLQNTGGLGVGILKMEDGSSINTQTHDAAPDDDTEHLSSLENMQKLLNITQNNFTAFDLDKFSDLESGISNQENMDDSRSEEGEIEEDLIVHTKENISNNLQFVSTLPTADQSQGVGGDIGTSTILRIPKLRFKIPIPKIPVPPSLSKVISRTAPTPPSTSQSPSSTSSMSTSPNTETKSNKENVSSRCSNSPLDPNTEAAFNN